MEMRDAVEADVGRLASQTGSPRDVMRDRVHDRTVRVAERDGDIQGFVSYDAREQTVYVTQLEGDQEIYDDLLEEPIRFARTENMAVEFLLTSGEDEKQDAAVAAGFERIGTGPQFDGESTVQYRIESP